MATKIRAPVKVGDQVWVMDYDGDYTCIDTMETAEGFWIKLDVPDHLHPWVLSRRLNQDRNSQGRTPDGHEGDNSEEDPQ